MSVELEMTSHESIDCLQEPSPVAREILGDIQSAARIDDGGEIVRTDLGLDELFRELTCWMRVMGSM